MKLQFTHKYNHKNNELCGAKKNYITHYKNKKNILYAVQLIKIK